MKATPEGKRIRSLVLGFIEQLATGVGVDAVMMSHVWQDDVRVIGFDLAAIAEPDDADSNADGYIHMYVELSRSGTRAQPGIIARVSITAVWNAAIVIGGPTDVRNTQFFPEGYGYDFNENDSINLNALLEYVGGATPLSTYGECIVYYVER